MVNFLYLSCQNCGATLKPPTDNTATCTFCGSSYFVPQRTPLGHLRDLETQALNISSFIPRLKKEGAAAIIVSAIKKADSGFKNPESLHMKVYAAHFPVWSLEVIVDCQWQGQYSERRTVTKYREISRQSASGSRIVVEPYTDTETVWHPQGGTHSFTRHIRVPAVSGMSTAQLKITLQSAGLQGDGAGLPEPESGMDIIPPTRSQQASWDEDECSAKFHDLGHAECGRLTERLTHCRVIPRVQLLGLIYVPLAEVSYEANSSEYCHCVNLCTGHYSGDLPLDEISVQKECLAVGMAQRKINSLRWLSLTIATPLLVVLACYGQGISSAERYTLWAMLGMLLLLSQPWRSPWADFLWSKRGHFARLLSCPPENMRHQMFARVSPQVMSLQSSLHEALQDNTLDGIRREKLLPALMHAGTVLLASAGASPTMRMPWAAQLIFPLCLGLAAYHLRPEVPQRQNHDLASPLPEAQAITPGDLSAAISPSSVPPLHPQPLRSVPDQQGINAGIEAPPPADEHTAMSATNASASIVDKTPFHDSSTPPKAPADSTPVSATTPEPVTHKPDAKLSSQERFNLWLEEDRQRKELFKKRFNSEAN